MKYKKITYKDLYIFFLIIYLICLPLNAMNIGSFGSLLKIFAILPISVAFLGGKINNINKCLLFQLLFTIFAFCSIIWSVSFDNSFDRAISYILLFILLLSGSMFKYNDNDIKLIKNALIWSSRLTAIILIIFGRFIQGRFWLSSIINEDPNYLCAYFSFGVIFCLEKLLKNNSKRKIIASIELLIYFLLVFLSGSRGGLLAIIGGSIAFLLTYGKNKKEFLLRKLVFITIAIVAVLILLDNLPSTLKLRFTVENVIESGGTGRTNLWRQSFDLFLNGNLFRQIFGYGTSTIRWCFTNYGYRLTNVSHNIFIETLAELGVIGLILYSLAIFLFINRSYKINDKFAFSVMFCMLIMSMSTSLYLFKPYFNIMLFIVMYQNFLEEKNIEKR